jgi:hypothetical protein
VFKVATATGDATPIAELEGALHGIDSVARRADRTSR